MIFFLIPWINFNALSPPCLRKPCGLFMSSPSLDVRNCCTLIILTKFEMSLVYITVHEINISNDLVSEVNFLLSLIKITFLFICTYYVCTKFYCKFNDVHTVSI